MCDATEARSRILAGKQKIFKNKNDEKYYYKSKSDY